MWKAMFVGALLLASGAAQAATVASPCGTSPRVVTLTTSTAATCLLASTGNLGGNGAVNDVFMAAFPTYVLIDKTDNNAGAQDGVLTGSPSLVAGLMGSFNIAALVGTYTNIALGFKFGGNQNTLLTSFVFLLPSGVTSGDWKFSAPNGLSHATLYGVRGVALPPPPPPVPVPAAGLLLIGALGGLAGLRRRKSREA